MIKSKTNFLLNPVCRLDSFRAERASRMDFMRNPDCSVLNQFNHAVTLLDCSAVRCGLMRAWEYAQSLDYNHPGQSKELYLAHPLRVTTLYMQLSKPADEEGLITAILHNVIEVSGVSVDILVALFGEDVAHAIQLLTVDRKRQWDADYKKSYYLNIENSPAFVARVKVLDKLDNLFTLCLNPSDEVREFYLKEIDSWLLPLAQKVFPLKEDYIRELVSDSRRVGHKIL